MASRVFACLGVVGDISTPSIPNVESIGLDVSLGRPPTGSRPRCWGTSSPGLFAVFHSVRASAAGAEACALSHGQSVGRLHGLAVWQQRSRGLG
jgi:hypothetical protein